MGKNFCTGTYALRMPGGMGGGGREVTPYPDMPAL